MCSVYRIDTRSFKWIQTESECACFVNKRAEENFFLQHDKKDRIRMTALCVYDVCVYVWMMLHFIDIKFIIFIEVDETFW